MPRSATFPGFWGSEVVSLDGTEGGFVERTFNSKDGLRLYWRDYEAPGASLTPVLCLGGLTRNSKDFHALARRLAGKRRVVAPDYRGRGRSAFDPDWRNYHPRTYVEDVRHLAAVAGLERFVVVGTSLGGLLAMVLAVTMPASLAGAVLNDIGPDIEWQAVDGIVAYMQDTRPLGSWEEAARKLQTTFPGLAARDEAGWIRIARATYREDPDGLLRFDWDPRIVRPFLAGDPIRYDLWPPFRALAGRPVLAIRGARSDLLGERTFQRMAAAMPDLATAVVPDVGHAPNLGEPESRDAIDALLARVDAAETAAHGR